MEENGKMNGENDKQAGNGLYKSEKIIQSKTWLEYITEMPD